MAYAQSTDRGSTHGTLYIGFRGST